MPDPKPTDPIRMRRPDGESEELPRPLRTAFNAFAARTEPSERAIANLRRRLERAGYFESPQETEAPAPRRRRIALRAAGLFFLVLGIGFGVADRRTDSQQLGQVIQTRGEVFVHRASQRQLLANGMRIRAGDVLYSEEAGGSLTLCCGAVVRLAPGGLARCKKDGPRPILDVSEGGVDVRAGGRPFDFVAHGKRFRCMSGLCKVRARCNWSDPRAIVVVPDGDVYEVGTRPSNQSCNPCRTMELTAGPE